MANEFKIPIKVLIDSNVEQFAASLKRAASTAARGISANAQAQPRSQQAPTATRSIASFEGQARAGLAAAKASGGLDEAKYQAGLRNLERQVADMRRQVQRDLGTKSRLGADSSGAPTAAYSKMVASAQKVETADLARIAHKENFDRKIAEAEKKANEGKTREQIATAKAEREAAQERGRAENAKNKAEAEARNAAREAAKTERLAAQKERDRLASIEAKADRGRSITGAGTGMDASMYGVFKSQADDEARIAAGQRPLAPGGKASSQRANKFFNEYDTGKAGYEGEQFLIEALKREGIQVNENALRSAKVDAKVIDAKEDLAAADTKAAATAAAAAAKQAERDTAAATKKAERDAEKAVRDKARADERAAREAEQELARKKAQADRDAIAAKRLEAADAKLAAAKQTAAAQAAAANARAATAAIGTQAAQARLAKAQNGPEPKTPSAAVSRQARALIEKRIEREATTGLVGMKAADRVAGRRENRDIEMASSGLLLPKDVKADADLRNAKKDHAVAVETRAAHERAADASTVKGDAELKAAKVEYNHVVKQEANEILRNRGFSAGGSRFQRAQQWIAERQGGVPRPANEFMNFKQLAASRVMTTASFAASGGLLYGAMNLGGNILRESSELQQELGIVRTQFEQVQATANGITFAGFKKQLHDVSVEAGVEANEVVKVQRQLAGAFADQQGRPNFDLAATEGATALKYSKISPLSQQEITDSMSAVSLAFRDASSNTPLPFEDILDTITGLENSFGVLGPEIVKFTADLAPLGKELGFTQDQLSGLGAVAQQRSGKSGAVLAEQLGRILPSLQDKQAELADLFDSNDKTSGETSKLLSAFQSGDTPRALELIVENYDKLDKAQQNQMASLVGSRREAATFYALLDSKKATLGVLGGDNDYSGSFDKRWNEYTKTVKYSTDRMRRSVEELGQKLFEAGVTDALSGMADAATLLAGGLSTVVDVIRDLNDLTGGYLPKLAAMALLFKGIGATSRMAGATGIGSMLTRGMPGKPGMGMTGPGGLMSPYSGGYGPAFALRPSTATAMASPTLGRLVTTDASGAATASIRTSMASAAAAAAIPLAGLAVSQLASVIQEQRAAVAGAKGNLRSIIAAKIADGVSPDKIRAIIDATLDDDTDSAWTTVRSWFGGDSNANNTANQMVGEEVARAVSERQTNQVRAIAEALSGKGKGGSDAERKALQDTLQSALFDVKEGTPLYDALIASGFTEASFDTEQTNGVRGGMGGAGTVETRKVSVDLIKKLAKLRSKDPTNESYKMVADFMIASVPPDLAAELQQIFATKPDPNEKDLAAADASWANFEQELESMKGAYEAGRKSIKPIIDRINERRRQLQGRLDDYVKAGNKIMAEKAQGQIDELNKIYSDTVVGDANASSDYRESVLSAMGKNQGVDGAKTGEDEARRSYEEISRYKYVTAAAKAEAATKLIEAQRAVLDEQISKATDPAEVARLVAQKVSIAASVRSDVVTGALQTGQESQVRDRIAAFFGIKASEADAIITSAIIQSDRINQSILVASLEGRRKQLQVAMQRIQDGKSTAGGLERIGSRIAESQIEAQLAVVEGLIADASVFDSVVDPGASVSGVAPDAAEAAASDAEAAARAAGELASARLARDPVAQARQNLANASAAVGRANTASERLSAMAQQVQAQFALEDAMQAMFEAQMDVANAISESVGDTVAVAQRQAQVANERLRQAQANGTGGAELEALKAAAIRANTNAVETARNDRIGDLDYLYEFDRITANEYIKQLKLEMEQIPEANKNARREIERKIKGIRDEMSSNSGFNIPSQIETPTLYEARRVAQDGRYGSSTVNNDNRTVDITIVESGDVNRTLRAVTQALGGAPPRSGLATTGEWV